MDFEEIKLILAMVREHDLAEFELEHQGFKIRIKKDSGHPIVVASPVAAAAVVPAVAAQLPAASAPADSAAPAAEDDVLVTVSGVEVLTNVPRTLVLD
jgi:biotin carboxyl carrier protein